MLKKIKQWFDGDSGEFTDGTKFRLSNVRAPEKYQFGGKTCTKRASGMTSRSNGHVNWRSVARDSYGRQVGFMSNKDGSINKRLIKRGCKNKGR